MSNTIMERLRNETKSAHQKLEKATIPFIKKATGTSAYACLLRMFYGYFKPVENQVHELIHADLIPDIMERRQSAALLADLNTIGDNTAHLALTDSLPVIRTVPQALGAMYVLEGSTLGGRFISQMLMKQLNRDAANGITFFSGYGEQTEAKWAFFTETMNAYANAHPLNLNEIVAAADETFTKFGEWVSIYGEKAEQIA